MGDVLRVRDYMNLPLIELAAHKDFDEDMFWRATKIYDAPMRELSERLDPWLNGIRD